MAKKFRVAMVGLGFGAEFIPIYQRHPLGSVEAICRRNEQELNAVGDKFGIGRYGFSLPMDEAAASVSLDISNRGLLKFDGTFPREQVGTLPTELVPHFFQSLSEAAGFTVHMTVTGDNTHHMIEACFKAFARTLRQAIVRTDSVLPSTKGAL